MVSALAQASDVVRACRRIYSAGLVQFGEGNVSARVPGADEFIITPTLNNYDKVSATDLVKMGFDGTQLGGGRKPSSEHRLHADIYVARPRVNFVIHTHSPYASMLSVARKPIPVVLEEMVIFLGGRVEVSEYVQANTEALGKAAVVALGESNAALLANHGMVAVGRNVDNALKACELVEKMAQVFWGASQVGEAHVVPAEFRKRFRDIFVEKYSTF